MLAEHRFWLQILGDHARFIFKALAPVETQTINKANYFMQVFDQLLAQATSNPVGLAVLQEQAYQYSQELRRFKLRLLHRSLDGKIAVGMPPTFFNHMLNELEEYLLLLKNQIAGRPLSPQPPVHYHLVWLSDAAFHAIAISSAVDGVEYDILHQAIAFQQDFTQLYFKGTEVKGYLRTGLQEFPALTRFNQQAIGKIAEFMEFLQELQKMRPDNMVLGTLAPLTVDHMLREECYYWHKIAASSSVIAPKCDPAKTRIEPL